MEKMNMVVSEWTIWGRSRAEVRMKRVFFDVSWREKLAFMSFSGVSMRKENTNLI